MTETSSELYIPVHVIGGIGSDCGNKSPDVFFGCREDLPYFFKMGVNPKRHSQRMPRFPKKNKRKERKDKVKKDRKQRRR
jgi:hypothetical protein